MLQGNPGARKARKRIGRGPGSGHGKTAGRGHKGQKARSGYSRRYGFEGGQMPLLRRIPKRGFHHRDRFPLAIVNVDTLDHVFKPGAVVTPETLVAAGLADACPGGVKVLGRGEIAKRLTVKVNAISPGARAKIEAAGGTVEILGAAPTAEAIRGQGEDQ
jgi:large subunit ribosomal protein L15